MVAFCSIICLFVFLTPSFAQTSASEVQGTEQALEKELDLRQRLEAPQKFYVKEITLEGVSLLTKEDITQITSPLEKHWLTIEDIRRLIESIKQAYIHKTHPLQPEQLSYELEAEVLTIRVNE